MSVRMVYNRRRARTDTDILSSHPWHEVCQDIEQDTLDTQWYAIAVGKATHNERDDESPGEENPDRNPLCPGHGSHAARAVHRILPRSQRSSHAQRFPAYA